MVIVVVMVVVVVVMVRRTTYCPPIVVPLSDRQVYNLPLFYLDNVRRTARCQRQVRVKLLVYRESEFRREQKKKKKNAIVM